MNVAQPSEIESRLAGRARKRLQFSSVVGHFDEGGLVASSTVAAPVANLQAAAQDFFTL